MEMTKATVEHIAKLSKLSFDEERYESFQKEFIKILDHFENLSGIEIADVDINDIAGRKSVLRSDDVHVFEDLDALVANVKKMRDGYIEIPKVVE